RNRFRRPAASSSVFTTIRRTPTPADCCPAAERAIVSVRNRKHRRLCLITDLLLRIYKPVQNPRSRNAQKRGKQGMPTYCATKYQTSMMNSLKRGYDG